MINFKRFKALLMAGVLTTGLCVSSMGAFAEDVPHISDTGKVTIEKTLEMAEGITVPAAGFEFSIESLTVNAPALSIDTIRYNSDTQTGDLAEGKYAINQSTVLDLNKADWKHAGEYVYTIKETPNTYQAGADESMIYDTNEYELHVYVTNTEDGGLKVSHVTAEDSSDTKQAEINFTNTYKKRGGSVDKASSLVISKSTEGDLADKTKEFEFKITLAKAATESADVTNVEAKLNGEVKTVKYGEEFAFYLKDGGTLVFENLPAGTRYTVTEVGAADGYTPSYELVENGGAPVSSEKVSEADNLIVNNALVGEKANSVEFTNTYEEMVITGVILNNLPFIILIAVAIAGIAGYVAVRRKIAR